MAPKLRVEYPAAVYHVMNRGDRREPIFRDDEGAEHYGSERQETVEAHAEGIVAEELKRRRWREEELERRAKGDAHKVTMAVRLRAETAVTFKWIAQRLQMGAPGYVNHLLYRRRKAKGE